MPNFGTRTREEFAAALATFVEGCAKIAKKPIVAEWLRKRVRLVEGGSAYCFVDYETGDVLKTASWSTPAPGARGNIFDPFNGLYTMTPYGAAYMIRG